MSLPQYPAYKDSGVEWLGRIPHGWQAKRVSWLFQLISGGTTPSTDDDTFYNGSTLWVTTGELRETVIYDTEKKVTDTALAAYPALRLYSPGTLLIALYGATVGRLALLGATACTNQACCAMARPLNVLPKFVFYGLLSAREHLVSIASGGGQPNISQEKLRSLRLGVPDLIEQVQIVAFLDRETAKIDALVAEQERLIGLLEKKRQAVISQAVTKGLDPNVPMRDSGVKWIGQIPSAWGLKRVKQVARLESGHTPSKQFPEYWEGGDIEWVSLNDSKWLACNDYISDTVFKITKLGLDNSSARLLPEGVLVFTRDATIGLTAITTKPMAVSQHLIAWCPSSEISSQYLLHVFNAMRPFLDSYTFGATIKTIGMADVKKLVTPVPPRKEQDRIVTFLSERLDKISALINEAESAIGFLRERRSALISAAVTGKIDVRGLAPAIQEAA